MKITRYDRKQIGPVRELNPESTRFYFPEAKTVVHFEDQTPALASRTHSAFWKYFLLQDKDTLQEAQLIAAGDIPKDETREYSNIRHLEYNSAEAQLMFKNFRMKLKLEEKVSSQLEELLRK